MVCSPCSCIRIALPSTKPRNIPWPDKWRHGRVWEREICNTLIGRKGSGVTVLRQGETVAGLPSKEQVATCRLWTRVSQGRSGCHTPDPREEQIFYQYGRSSLKCTYEDGRVYKPSVSPKVKGSGRRRQSETCIVISEEDLQDGSGLCPPNSITCLNDRSFKHEAP